MEADRTFEYFLVVSKHRMVSHYFPKLKICLENMSTAEIWETEQDGLNSIGGVILHIVEHLNRNTLRLLEPDMTFDKGIENYFPMAGVDKASLTERLETGFTEWENALETAERKRVDLYNVYHLVEHTGYHLGQIIDRTQRITGKRFQFVQNGINEKALKTIVEEEINKER